jgi:hypothetical protein
MTEFIHMLSNNIQLSRECILSIEKFQVTMQDKNPMPSMNALKYHCVVMQ